MDLLQRLEPLGLEHDDHPPMIPNSDRLQAHFTLESRPPFRLMCRWKRLIIVACDAFSYHYHDDFFVRRDSTYLVLLC